MYSYNLVGYNQKIDLNTLKQPLYLYLELNNSCNLRCKFCSVAEKNNDYMNIKLVKKVLKEMKKNCILDVYYTGGEPLLHPDFIEIVNFANDLGIRQTLLTNGLLLNNYEKILDKLMCVCVSLHGNSIIHNKIVGTKCYDKIIDNIILAKKYTNVKINCTVTKDNQDINNLKTLLELGIKYNLGISFSKYNNIGDGKKNNCDLDVNLFIETLNELKELGYEFRINDCVAPCLVDDKYSYMTHGCGAGYLFGSIDYNGNLKICPSSIEVLGNINEKSFLKIWYQKQLKEFRNFDWLPLTCKSCKYLSKCRAGCKVELRNKITNFNDYYVQKLKDDIWEKIKNKNLRVNIGSIRIEDKDYICLSNPARKFNKKTYSVLKKLNEGVCPKQLQDAKELILSLYRDGIIVEVE